MTDNLLNIGKQFTDLIWKLEVWIKVYCHALPSKSATTTNWMEVVFWLGMEVIIDNQRNLLHINTPSQQVSCDQNKWGTRSKFPHNNIPGVLIHVPMSSRDSMVTSSHLDQEVPQFPQTNNEQLSLFCSHLPQ